MSLSAVSCSPTGEMVEKFLLATEHMQQLMEYVNWGSTLPAKFEDYTLDMELTKGTVKQFTEEIKMIVVVYAQIKENCTRFKQEILPKCTKLCDEVYNYSDNALGTHNLFYLKLKDLDKVIESDYKLAKQLRSEIDGIVDEDIKILDCLISDAGALFDELCLFEQQTVDGSVNIRRKTVVLQRTQAELEVNQGVLTLAITALTQSSDAHKADPNADQTTSWVPLVGDVPKAVLDTPEGSIAARLINDTFSDKNGTKLDDEVVQIQYQHMLDQLSLLYTLIEPAKETINILQGFFALMKHDLEHVKTFVKRSRRLSEIMNQGFDERQKNWNRLKAAARHYQQTVFISTK